MRVCFTLDNDNVAVAESILKHYGRKTTNFHSESPLPNRFIIPNDICFSWMSLLIESMLRLCWKKVTWQITFQQLFKKSRRPKNIFIFLSMTDKKIDSYTLLPAFPSLFSSSNFFFKQLTLSWWLYSLSKHLEILNYFTVCTIFTDNPYLLETTIFRSRFWEWGFWDNLYDSDL